MKVRDLISKLQQFHPDSDLTEIDVWRLFDDDSVAQEIDAKFERVQKYLASGDLDGLRELIEKEKCPGRGLVPGGADRDDQPDPGAVH